ncbi:MAG TPA: hypothetical protein VM912_07265 [Terriglobales bacterium]|nr:hypothetical protein [Terriglobales bacterium]
MRAKKFYECTKQLFSADCDDNLFASAQAGERALNRAIVTAEIGRSYEEYLEIFDRFYAEDIEVSSATSIGQIRGKGRVSSLLYDFLVPLHILAEIGGVSVSIRQIKMPGDAADETHSAWTLDLVGATGRSCTASCVRFGSGKTRSQCTSTTMTSGKVANR